MKKILSMVLCIVMVFVMATTLFAAAPETDIQPLWENMGNSFVMLSFDGSNGLATGRVNRLAGITTLIEGTLTVYEVRGNSLIYVDSTYMSSTRSLGITLEFDAESGTEYLAALDIIAHSEISSETDTLIDYGTCP